MSEDPRSGAAPKRGREQHCSSCGSDAVEVVAVRRVYVTPADWDQEERVEVVDEVELWCWPCRTHYPHQEVDQGAG